MSQLNITWKGSPNFWDNRSGYKPEAIVIHIMCGTLIGTDSWFANSQSQLSAHYGIGQAGDIHQYVKEECAAWHAGQVNSPLWNLLKPNINPNLYTVGIEHEGNPDTVWPDTMKAASAALIYDICKRWNIPIDRQHIIGHYQIDGVRKSNCPAYNKAIIDELIVLANQQEKPKLPLQVEEGISKIEEGIALIKQATA